MFLHTLIETKEVDLDQLLEDMRSKASVVNPMIEIFGSTVYAFIVDCVDKQIQEIKAYTPMPIEGE